MIQIVPILINLAIIVGVAAFIVIKLKAVLNSITKRNSDIDRLSREVDALKTEVEELSEKLEKG